MLTGPIPRHVAIIMDGNGRWARERHLPRPFGHRAGMKSVREAVEGAIDAGVEVLTLFAFSEENWSRPAPEISALMDLLEEYIAKEIAELSGQGVRVHVLGDRARLTPGGRAAVERGERETAGGGPRQGGGGEKLAPNPVLPVFVARENRARGAALGRGGPQGHEEARGHRR